MKLDPYLTPYTHIQTNSWVKDLDVKGKLIKFLEDSIRENSDNLELGGDFLDTIPKA